MKIFIKCESPLLQKTLEIYLKEHICERKNADFFIGDVRKYFEKPLFLISKNSPYLTIPFTQKDLICALEEYSFILKNTGNKISKNEPFKMFFVLRVVPKLGSPRRFPLKNPLPIVAKILLIIFL